MFRKILSYSLGLFGLLLLLNSCKDDSNTTSNSSVIWRGFHHVWEYNHRVNRMGDWVGDIDNSNGFSANAYHSAASGIGPDRIEYKSFFTSIKTSDAVNFSTVNQEIRFQGIEGTVDSQTIEISLEIPSTTITNASVVLNGFDMYALPFGTDNLLGDGDADKLFNFSLQTSNVTLQKEQQKTIITFDLHATLGADCTSPECSVGATNDWFDYLVTAYFQIISADDTYLSETTKRIEQSYEWERPMNNNSNEIFEENFVINNINVNGLPGIPVGISAIKGFTFETTQGYGGFGGQSFEYPHMQTFNIALKPQHYDTATGSMLLDADLFFKNWAAPVPFFSFGGGGTLKMETELALVQINDKQAKVDHFSIEDEFVWLTNPLDPSPPNVEASLNWHPISVSN